MKRFFSIGLCLAFLALCTAPLFFPHDAKAKEPPQVHASDLEAKDTGTDYDVLTIGEESDDPVIDSIAQAQASNPAAPEPETTLWQRIFAYLRENTAEAVMALLMIGQIIVNLTPTEKDNGWFLWLRRIFEMIFPNLKKGGGTFPPPPKA